MDLERINTFAILLIRFTRWLHISLLLLTPPSTHSPASASVSASPQYPLPLPPPQPRCKVSLPLSLVYIAFSLVAYAWSLLSHFILSPIQPHYYLVSLLQHSSLSLTISLSFSLSLSPEVSPAPLILIPILSHFISSVSSLFHSLLTSLCFGPLASPHLLDSHPPPILPHPPTPILSPHFLLLSFFLSSAPSLLRRL